MSIKAQLPKGLRDFLPNDVAKRSYIIEIMKEVFELFAYQPIETPVMEGLETLTGKYGEEGDKLLFKVLNNGDFLSKVDSTILENKDSNKAVSQLSKRGLRYDLTVPLARYVVQNQNDLVFPFKRYHIAPVWRADRPQKGRYQEFYQCDVDVIGSNSFYNEVELMQMYALVFEKLGLDVTIRYNSRKLLLGLMQFLGLKGNETQGISILDKLDKIGLDKVLLEFQEIGVANENIAELKNIISNNDFSKLPNTEILEQGKQEVAFLTNAKVPFSKFDISLARGLDYYTGCIFEVVSNEYEMGSIGGGGRYDNLTEMFGKSDMTGVGVSFGLERIYDIMEALNKFPENLSTAPQLLFAYFDEKGQEKAFETLSKLRNKGVKTEMYPDITKFAKQMKYADSRGINYVAIIGDNEIAQNKYMLKEMKSGKQELVDFDTLVKLLKD
ncbi:MAG: histidine--tRNA ligase [Chitinophagales bacterium]